MPAFILARRQLKVLKQLNESYDYLLEKRKSSKEYSYDTWVWSNPDKELKPKEVPVSVVADLISLNLVDVRVDENGRYCTISLSGQKYLESLEVPEEDRLNLETLEHVRKLMYNPAAKKKTKDNIK